MSPRRLAATFNVEFWHSLRRPLFICLGIVLALSAWGLSTGHMAISSGDSAVGGTKAWITSEFAQTQMMTFLTLLYYAFFIASAAGLSLLRDHETKVDVLLHSTPLRPSEYVWGRFLAIIAGFVVLLGWQMAITAFFNHVVPNASAKEIRGPFDPMNYLKPALLIGLPFLVFFAGVAMWLGEKTRNAVLVFVLPVAALLVCGFFLWTWSPSWLDLRVNRLLQVLEPTAYRWLNETHLKVDRGVQFYNHDAVPYAGLFWLNRLWVILVGLGAVALTQRAVAVAMRGAQKVRVSKRAAAVATPAETADDPILGEHVLAGLVMRSGTPRFLASIWTVARVEMHGLLRQPGLYIFVPIILLQVLGNALTAIGAFDTPLLLTSGTLSVTVANQISVLVCLLLLFYTVESLERERATGLAPILYATPLRTAALLFGKSIANSMVGVVILLGALVSCGIALAVQGTVPFRLMPFVLTWALLLVPTFLAWSAFVTMVYAGLGNRYAAYAVSLAVLIFTGFRALTRQINWAGNWPLWGALRWSDLGFYETDRMAMILNRVMVVSLAILFTVIAVRLFGRRGADPVRVMHRLAPQRLALSGLRMAPYALVPAFSCVALIFMVHGGLDGGTAKKANKDYWAKNLKTWLDAPLPDIGGVDIELKIDPEKHWLSSAGTMTLVNPLDSTLAQLPLTGGRHWKNLKWTMNGAPVVPVDNQHLYVFTPPRPLAQGDSVVIGWSWDGRYPDGVTKTGGSTEEFILPSGVVLTGFSPSFMPVVGYMDQVGETKDNRSEPKRYPRDYWKGVTRAGFGADSWFPARIEVTGPSEYTLNSVGVCTSNTVKDGWRTQQWETDHPVKLLNVVCGRWKEKRGNGTTIYYSEAHPYNIEQMSETLDAARHWYSQWFMQYPWKELKLSEFPGLAGYAQGFATDITFSENIGFLTKNDAKSDATFLVTAHEAAHQWWGNILTPADGPNANILSEGMSHFSTLLLFEQVRGPRGRMEFARGIESRYGDRRNVDDERPMYDVDGRKSADETVVYDRGGWVFWMLYDFLGHERALAGYSNFIQTWSQSRDHATLQDFVAAMRPYAGDPIPYDAFVKQWFEDKVVPEYRVREAVKTKKGSEYEVTMKVENIGTGRMPVEVAAIAGERWVKPKRGDKPGRAVQDPKYRESRGEVVLGPGEKRMVTIRCAFDPEKVVVDPDVRVLQIQRKLAVATL